MVKIWQLDNVDIVVKPHWVICSANEPMRGAQVIGYSAEQDVYMLRCIFPCPAPFPRCYCKPFPPYLTYPAVFFDTQQSEQLSPPVNLGCSFKSAFNKGLR